MSIHFSKIRRECRRRMIEATGIDPIDGLQEENKVISNINGGAWIAEFCIGGSESGHSARRSRATGFMIQYDVHCAEGQGTSRVDELCEQISDAFDITSTEKSIFSIDNMDIVLVSVKIEDKKFAANYAKSVLLTFNISCRSAAG